MIYPEPIGANPLSRLDKKTIAAILERSSSRFVGDRMFRKHCSYGKMIDLCSQAIRNAGGWASADEVAEALNKTRKSMVMVLSRFGREKRLKYRYRPNGVREYGL